MTEAKNSGKVAIIIPTFNEAENIEDLIVETLKALPGADIIVVDDNSPDGTADIVAKIADPRARVIIREQKNGRGGAVLDGIRSALSSDQDYQRFIEMDADFSHHPKYLIDILEKAESCDVVIGSRYLPGAEIVNWSAQRKIFSFLANRFARILLGVPITDYTNGYRCYSREAARNIPFDKIEATGYIVLSEVAVGLHKRKVSFGEVPITFVNRARGLSKLSLKEILSAAFGIVKLKSRFGELDTQAAATEAEEPETAKLSR